MDNQQPHHGMSLPQPSWASPTPCSIKITDSETTVIRKDVNQLWHRSILPHGNADEHGYSISSPETDSTFVNLPLDDLNQGPVDQDANVVWWSPQDRDDPLSWPRWKKALNITIICSMCFISPFSSSVFAPAVPNMTKEFDETDVYLSAFVVSSYVLGYAVGPLVVGPLSEVWGRVCMYHICNLAFVAFTCACALTHNLKTLAIVRFFAGCGGSSVWTLAPASVADMVQTKRRGPVLALIGLCYNLGPSVSPLIGSHVNVWLGWRWIFWLTAIMGGAATMASFAGLSETYAPMVLESKARRLRNRSGNQALRSGLESALSQRQILTNAMLRPLKMLILPNVLLVSLLTAAGYGFLYILYTTFPTTFIALYSWEPRHVGYVYLGTAVGNILGLGLAAGLSEAIAKRRAANGDTKPENRLIPMIMFWPLVPTGLFIYAWSAQKSLHYMVPLVGTALFGAGTMSAIFLCGLYIVDAYTTHSASGMAASTVLRSLLGGLVPLFANKLYAKYDVGWAFSILAFLALALAPVPWLFYRYGEGLRTRFKPIPYFRTKHRVDMSEVSLLPGNGRSRPACEEDTYSTRSLPLSYSPLHSLNFHIVVLRLVKLDSVQIHLQGTPVVHPRSKMAGSRVEFIPGYQSHLICESTVRLLWKYHACHRSGVSMQITKREREGVNRTK
ncbi:MFS general substrate transporter [Pleomassaria siparia CBS 279.74]|uniref:MFS general substrate transporter n=1 Tax=Pleomassaria siparia CBS 279.74 TaxID=1314801 RepID=A0A6G1KIU7_9PLEO|nr:MFS general substrate transporter [Pleomassaria siparia CBS 279.74]